MAKIQALVRGVNEEVTGDEEGYRWKEFDVIRGDEEMAQEEWFEKYADLYELKEFGAFLQ